MGDREGLGRLGDDLERLVRRGESAAREPVRERLSLDELHHEIELRALAPGIVHRHDSRMQQARAQPRLAQEAGFGLATRARPFRICGRDHLDRDLPVEARIVGPEDRSHRPAADLFEETIPADLPWRGGHRRHCTGWIPS
ncbi:MAG: hypothetical protein BWX64_02767 [Acidobacteria bacterium ADurb.Bin051]|nr:MAG: hypothetical protein BWX64_02767 [Acidobacteria bacterium ADurb.Bin051]